jgi:glutathione peroxidase
MFVRVNSLLVTAAVVSLLTALVGCNGSTESAGGADEVDRQATGLGSAVAPQKASDGDSAPRIYQFSLSSITGQPVDMSRYKGKTLLIVNTASKCGHTPQYAGLQKLHEVYGDRGLAVLGFPANNFGGQEPGDDAQIAAFCETNFGVQFDMFSKVSVKGDDQHELFAYLTSQPAPPVGDGQIKWNFEKFLVGPDGKLVARYRSGVKPQSEQLIAAIERQLD